MTESDEHLPESQSSFLAHRSPTLALYKQIFLPKKISLQWLLKHSLSLSHEDKSHLLDDSLLFETQEFAVETRFRTRAIMRIIRIPFIITINYIYYQNLFVNA